MKVYISNYRDHWLSPYTILEKVFFWREIDYDEPIIERLSNILLPFCKALQTVSEFIYPRINYVKVDYWDTWSMDSTLAPIILALLKQLRETKHGSPCTDDDDVPEHLKSTSAPPKENEWSSDANIHDRWDWILNEMIWAFEYKVKDDEKSDFGPDWQENHKRMQNGFCLFGKYFLSLWD